MTKAFFGFNLLLANAFFLSGYIESWGRGIEKIAQEVPLKKPRSSIGAKKRGMKGSARGLRAPVRRRTD